MAEGEPGHMVDLYKKILANQMDALEEELLRVRTALVEDQMIYPMNYAKTQACQVVRKGDYAALFLVGAIDMREDASEEEQLSFAKEEVQKAVDAFEGCF